MASPMQPPGLGAPRFIRDQYIAGVNEIVEQLRADADAYDYCAHLIENDRDIPQRLRPTALNIAAEERKHATHLRNQADITHSEASEYRSLSS